MKLRILWSFIFLLIIEPQANWGSDRCRILPTPQYCEYLNDKIVLPRGEIQVNYVVPARMEPQIRVAMDLISETLKELGFTVNASQVSVDKSIPQTGLNISLLPYAHYSERPGSDTLLSED